MSFEIEGKLYKVYPTEQKTASFQAREFGLEIMSGNYPQYIKFQLTQEKCTVIDGYQEGDSIKVYFDLRGREWNGKILSNLNAWRVEGATLGANTATTTSNTAAATPNNSFGEEPAFPTTNDAFAGMGEPMQFDNDLPF
jgi:single-strand DNA-binding protein